MVIRALCYIKTLGGEGLKAASENAVLNANYLRVLLKAAALLQRKASAMHEFVLSLEQLKKETGVSAMDAAKTMIDFGMHPPTMITAHRARSAHV